MALPIPTASAVPARRRAHRRARILLLAALLATGLAALAGCFRQLELKPLQPDPGIAAALSVVQSRTQTLFGELERGPALPYAQADAAHYRPLLADLGQAQHLARVHERSQAERRALDELAETYEQLRTRHREGALDVQSLRDFRARLDRQLESLQRMDRS